MFVLAKYIRDIKFIVKEPVFRFPVLVIESDDWSPGNHEQVDALEKIKNILEKHVDDNGVHPVMSIGLVLSSAELESLCSSEPALKRVYFDSEPFAPIMNALIKGEKAGFYEIHLHGLDHFWEHSLKSYIKKNLSQFQQEYFGQKLLRNECLPAYLQSRWAECDCLPCKTLDNSQIEQAVNNETAEFYRILNREAEVVVPPTFLWTKNVEKFWAKNGVKVIVTPGSRFVSRDENGNMVADIERIYNGMTTEFGQTYMVRNGYFEPGMGHTASSALEYIKRSVYYGRPCLIESHRFNYINDDESYDAYDELDKFYTKAGEEFYDLKFSSTSELAKSTSNINHYFQTNVTAFRVIIWMRRIFILPGFKRLSFYSGMIIAWFFVYFVLSVGLWFRRRRAGANVAR